MALVLSGSLALGATYRVDASKGDDSAAGSEAAPWKTISRGVKDLKPGDTLRIASGVYRETVAPACRGTAEAPITIQGVPGGRALITGADEIEGWKPCTKDDVAGHPDFQRIYWADVDFLPTVLLDARKERPTTRFPREGFFPCTAATADTLADKANLTQSRDVWAMSLINLRFADGKEERRVVLGFDASTHTVKLNRPMPADARLDAGAVQYYIEGRLPGLAEGQWAYENRGENKYRVYYWPAGGDIAKAAVEMPRRTHGVNLSEAAYVTVDGLEVAYGAGDFAIGAMTAKQDRDTGAGDGLVIRNCLVHDHQRIGVQFGGCRDARLLNSAVYDCAFNVRLIESENTLIEQNEIGAYRNYGILAKYDSGTVVRKNLIHHRPGSLANCNHVHLHPLVRNITFEENLFVCGGPPFMMMCVDGVTFRNNVFLGSTGCMVMCLASDNPVVEGHQVGKQVVDNLVFERNTCALEGTSVLSLSTGTGYRVNGNIMADNNGSFFYAVPPSIEFQSDDNIFWTTVGPTVSRPWRCSIGEFGSLDQFRKATSLEARSEFKDPQFRNAPQYVVNVDRKAGEAAADKVAPGSAGLFQVGDHMEINFDGVVRTVTAAEPGVVTFDPPLAREQAFVTIANWKHKTDFTYDFSSPLNGRYGSTVNVPAYLRCDFDGDGKRDVPEVPRIILPEPSTRPSSTVPASP
jgi:hypothetical protein